MPTSIGALNLARFDDENIKDFMTALTDEKLSVFVEMWDHSTTNSKYKVEQVMMEEPNLKNVDEVAELVGAFSNQFKDRFRACFTSEKIGDELKFQVRKRREDAMAI